MTKFAPFHLCELRRFVELADKLDAAGNDTVANIRARAVKAKLLSEKDSLINAAWIDGKLKARIVRESGKTILLQHAPPKPSAMDDYMPY